MRALGPFWQVVTALLLAILEVVPPIVLTTEFGLPPVATSVLFGVVSLMVIGLFALTGAMGGRFSRRSLMCGGAWSEVSWRPGGSCVETWLNKHALAAFVLPWMVLAIAPAPLIRTPARALYTSHLPQRLQGTMQGVSEAAFSFANFLGPILGSHIAGSGRAAEINRLALDIQRWEGLTEDPATSSSASATAMADESDTAPTPTASKREESGGLGGEDESAEPSTPAPRASGPRRSSKRPVVPVMDPESNLSPTVARSRKRQAIAGDRAGGGGAETEEDAFAKDREIKRLQQDLNEQKMVANEEDDTMEVREVCAHRLEYIKREDLQIKERESRLSAERTVHQKQRMLVNAEDRSQIGHVVRMCFCAIKINEIEAKMTDAQRQDLVRWALREYEIQKKLQHPRIVQLRDCFALDTWGMRSALAWRANHQQLHSIRRFPKVPHPPRNSSGRKIIHYDIKPSNLFYHAGQVKIGDFGLSKMADTPHPEGVIDLSTRGAGTSWYLPPECHEIASPTINSKVDVWSTGVVFFELLFGRRPFGEGRSQDAFRREGSFDLTMPTAPRVSNEAKDEPTPLLIRDRDQRPDVHEALQDPYIRPVKANDTRRRDQR
eukprot:g32057.t1